MNQGVTNNAVAKRKILGQGVFGIVVGPALPNRNASGKNIHYPGNVTKIYRKKVNYHKAINNSKTLKEKIPHAIVELQPYEHKYTLKNLNHYLPNKENRNKVKAFLQGYKNSNDLPMLRLPYLGISVEDILKHEGLLRQFRELPFRDVCAHLYKCMYVIQSIYRAGYIHGDIRPPNLLIDLNTGNMTINDFDLMRSFDDFFEKFHTFFMNQPPECLLIWVRYPNNSTIMRFMYGNGHLTITTKATRNLYTNLKTLNPQIVFKYDVEKATKAMVAFGQMYSSTMRASMCEEGLNSDQRADRARKVLFEMAKETIDSYGFAYTIIDLLTSAWSDITEDNVGDKPFAAGEYDKFNTIRNFVLNTMIPSMMDNDYRTRWDITKAMTEFKRALDGIGFDVEKCLKEKYPKEMHADTIVNKQENKQENKQKPTLGNYLKKMCDDHRLALAKAAAESAKASESAKAANPPSDNPYAIASAIDIRNSSATGGTRKQRQKTRKQRQRQKTLKMQRMQKRH
jgi:serine/threonine protein kinase